MPERQKDPASPPDPGATYFIGTSGWTYDHWKGRFYPGDLAKKAWFDYYATQFNAVEINATFYRTFRDQTYQKWQERAPAGFGYVLKAPRLITHRKYLVDVQQDIHAFYRSCTILGDKFEMILLQVAPNMTYDLDRLRQALSAFPDPSRVAVEFRRPEWQSEATMQLLRNAGAAICNVDSPRQEISAMLTSRRAYLRLHGRGHWYFYNYSDQELHEIAALARSLAHKGTERIYIFFNNDFEGYAPANARTLRQILAA